MSNEIVGRGWAFPVRTDSRGQVALTSDRSELNQAIQIILMTAPGQRVMRPAFGCRIHDLIFAPVNSQTMAQAQRYVQEALAMWEPRIIVTQINVWPEDRPDGPGNCMMIEIEYKVKATHDQRSLIFPFYLIPEEANS